MGRIATLALGIALLTVTFVTAVQPGAATRDAEAPWGPPAWDGPEESQDEEDAREDEDEDERPSGGLLAALLGQDDEVTGPWQADDDRGTPAFVEALWTLGQKDASSLEDGALGAVVEQRLSTTTGADDGGIVWDEDDGFTYERGSQDAERDEGSIAGPSGGPGDLLPAEKSHGGPLGCEGRTPHPPIVITEDEGPQGFKLADDPRTGEPIHRPGSGVVAGNGTAQNPYVIEGWCITGSQFLFGFVTDAGIRIQDTTAHVVIQNNTIVNNRDWGIELDTADRITIQNNTIAHQRVAILSVDSNATTVANNTITDNTDAIVLVDGAGATIAGNSIQNGLGGVWLLETNGTVLTDNEIVDHAAFFLGLGVLLFDTEATTIANNTIEDTVSFFLGGGIISLDDHGGSTIVDNQIIDNLIGAFPVASNATTFERNTFSDNLIGILPVVAPANTFRDNQIGEGGMLIAGSEVDDFRQTIDATNTVNGEPLRYVKDASGVDVPTPAGQVIVANASDVTVGGATLTNTSVGLQAAFTEELLVEESEIAGNLLGAILNQANRTLLQTSNVTENEFVGLGVVDSLDVRIHANNLEDNVERSRNGLAVDAVGDSNVDARWNWWGCEDGPGADGCDAVDGLVQVRPWLRAPWEEVFPIVPVSFSSSCLDFTCSFDASAFSVAGIASYEWDFGDGNTSTGQQVNHTYGAAGTFDVTLTVEDGDGRTNTSATQVTVPVTVLLQDSFDDGVVDKATWPDTSNAAEDDLCGAHSDPFALSFTGSGARYATTKSLAVDGGEVVEFHLKIGQDVACEQADFGEGIILQYSTDDGVSWNTLAEYAPDAFPDFTRVQETLPGEAAGVDTRLRWVQPQHTGFDFDEWAIDDVRVKAGEGSGLAAPSAPQNLTAEDKPARVLLDWAPPTGPEPVQRYTIYRQADQCGNAMTPIANVSADETAFVDRTGELGQVYCYVVTASNPGGESNQSNEATGTPLVPPDPAITDVTVEKTKLRTDYTEPVVNPVAHETVRVTVENLGPTATEDDGHVHQHFFRTELHSVGVTVLACPQEADRPLVEFAKHPFLFGVRLDDCETLEHADLDALDPGETDTIETSLDPLGKAGDYEIRATLDYERPELEETNNEGSQETFVIVGGTGAGGVNAP